MMTRPALTAGLLAANLVVLSLIDHVRGHYTVLIALGMLACCVWLSAIALRSGRGAWLLLFLPLALLWNPLVPVRLQADDWLVTCAAAAAGLLLAAFLIRRSPPEQATA